ncbi:MAG TPA: 3-deoxy-D-manno-octulosonic acid transferase [Candidatus Acidoferrales bacterium]|jgi:3-deoxy-D-manno-octulosonic-acid transferase
MYFLYSVLSATGMLLLAPYFLIKYFLNEGTRQKKYLQNLPERLGLRFPNELGPEDARRTIWIHAVSVGEVLAAVPLARALAEKYPEKQLVISTTTATGQALAHERMKFAEAIFYFPLDWRGPVKRAVRAVKPELVVIFETEIWPNFLREARRAGVPVIFVNGRISSRSFQRFSRALRLSAGLLRGFLGRVLNDATLYLMQSEQDRERVVALGAEPERVVAAGNMKYDLAVPDASPLANWLTTEASRARRGPVLVAGSVIAGEEIAVLEALDVVEQKWPDALLVMAPRKPERFAAAAALIEQSGRRVVRRSELVLDDGAAGAPCARRALGCAPGERGSVLLLDTIGELTSLYGIADAVFVGGSLAPGGGHNPLEPAALGKAPVFGASMDNFRDVASAFLAADAAIEVHSGAELGAAWSALLADEPRRERMGRAARELVERHRGATQRALARIETVLVAGPAAVLAAEKARR